jgi:hypothetical protein
MDMRIKAGARRATTALLVACLAMPATLWAQAGAVDEDPSAGAMIGDFFVARPIGLALTLGGTALWVVSLPFTLLAGHANEAAETLMVGPGEMTFMRCLGCRNPGYTDRDIELKKKQDAAAKADVASN